jgi:hypothetical protein
MGELPDGSLIVAYGSAGGSDAGGPQQLDLVDSGGHATPYGTTSSRQPSGRIGGFATDRSGGQVSFTTFQDEGICGGMQVAYVVNSSTGSVTAPTTPGGGGPNGFWVEGLWFDAAGTAYASFLPNPTGCDASGNPVSASPAAPQNLIVCKLVGQQWVQTSGGVLQAAYASGGWLAEQSGPVSTAFASDGLHPLVISRGGTSITVPGVSAFAWAP